MSNIKTKGTDLIDLLHYLTRSEKVVFNYDHKVAIANLYALLNPDLLPERSLVEFYRIKFDQEYQLEVVFSPPDLVFDTKKLTISAEEAISIIAWNTKDGLLPTNQEDKNILNNKSFLAWKEKQEQD